MSKIIIIGLLIVLAIVSTLIAIGVIYIVIDTIKFNNYIRKSLKENTEKERDDFY